MSDNYNISEELVTKLINNQRSDRRWKNIRFFCVILILFAAILSGYFFLMSGSYSDENEDYVSLVRLNGYILPGASFSAENVLPLLNAAFSDKKAKGVVLAINSGGGSPVQSAIIHDKILELKKKYKKRVVVVGEDILASGAYLVAMAGDKVYVNQDTITGSIGVVMQGFGFSDAMQKVGITRRVFTAGENKVRLDPFQPLSQKDIDKTKAVLEEVHQHFIQYVTESRGDRLTGDKNELFSGDFWPGSTALKYGIVDGLANLSEALPKEFDTIHYVDYSLQPTVIEMITKGLKSELDIDFGTTYHQSRLVSAI